MARPQRQAMYALADTLNLPLLDMSDRSRPWSLANANALMAAADGFHPKANGYALKAGGVADVLVPA